MTAFARPRGLVGLVAGFLVWSSAFLVLYGLHALGCAWGWDARSAGGTSPLRIALVVAWTLHAALAAALVLVARRLGRGVGTRPGTRDGAGLVARASLVLSIAALAATLWTGLPVVAYPLCR